MNNDPVRNDFFLQPGYVCVPAEPTRLAVVVSSGVAVTLFDARTKRGGMSHYIQPYRPEGQSTAIFAAPSIITLIRMLENSGSTRADLEAHLYGGALNPDHRRHDADLSDRNVSVGREILEKMRIPIAGEDTGGRFGRKIIFNTGTGEVVLARVERIRESDWYPSIEN